MAGREQWARVFLGLGSNLGDRHHHLLRALEGIRDIPMTRLLRVSACYETAPWGDLNQGPFLNLAAEIETALAPLELLKAVKTVEAVVGRQKTRHWGPREIDIDIVLWEARTLNTPALTLPHPEFRRRAFVLAPLADIAPDAIDPITGESMAALAVRPEAQGEVTRVGPPLLAPAT